jgi:adenosylmethionine-8-amino-7-oxononanoate aminotransferase
MTFTASTSPTDQVIMISASKVFHRTLKHEPIFIERAQGNYIYEKGGRKLLDACGGAAVTSIGHGNQQVIRAVTEQLQAVPYVHSGNFATQGAEDLADKLCQSSGMARAVFMTGGSEAVESAIKVELFCLPGLPVARPSISRRESAA